VYAIRTRLGQPVAEGEVLALVDSEAVGRAKADYLRELFLTRYKGAVLERYRAIGAAVVPERSILEAEMELKEAELRQFTAQQRLINLGLEPPEPDAKTPTTPQEFARQIQFLGLPDAVVTKLQPRPKTSNLIPLLAPFDGVVTRQDVVAGEVVSPDRPAFAVANLSTVWLNLAVRKEDTGRIRVGQTVRFSAAGLPGPVSGTLDWIVPEADEKTRTVRARCTLANPVTDGGERLLRINLFGSAEIVLARREAIVIPDTAIQRLADGVPVVFVRGPDGLTFAPRPIRIGPSRGGLTEILDGLTTGTSVVTSGSYVLKSELMKDSLTAN
jgi:cobalt-zinc-cadmium efflux system membrane fusion protein